MDFSGQECRAPRKLFIKHPGKLPAALSALLLHPPLRASPKQLFLLLKGKSRPTMDPFTLVNSADPISTPAGEEGQKLEMF